MRISENSVIPHRSSGDRLELYWIRSWRETTRTAVDDSRSGCRGRHCESVLAFTGSGLLALVLGRSARHLLAEEHALQASTAEDCCYPRRKMDVTRKNFIEALAYVESLLPEATFACIDLEFTGLGSTRPSQLDTPAVRYATVREDADKFPPIQFGLALFKRARDPTSTDQTERPEADQDDANGRGLPQAHWQVTSFNFNVLPRASYYPPRMRYPVLDRIFNFQASTIQFLSSAGFNFMKLFEDGISWMLPEHEQTYREHVASVLQKKRTRPEVKAASRENAGNDDNRKLRLRWEQLIAEWLNELKHASPAKQQSVQVRAFSLPRLAYERHFVFDYIRTTHPRIAASTMSGQEGTQVKLQLYPTIEDAQSRQEEMLLEEVEHEVSRSVAFRLVVDAMRRAKIPIIVHNGLMDLVKVYANFVGPPSESMLSFKTAFQEAFPVMYDTRWMLQQECDRHESIRKLVDANKVRGIRETRRVLTDEARKLGILKATPIVRTFVPTGKLSSNGKRIGAAFIKKDGGELGYEIFGTVPEVQQKPDVHGFGRYAEEDSARFEHEAGFDALETGLLFLLFLEMQNQSAMDSMTPGVSLGDLNGALNQIYLGSCGGYRRIDLQGGDAPEENVFFRTGNGIVVTVNADQGKNGNSKIATPRHFREVLSTVTKGTQFEGGRSLYFPSGPTTFLALLHRSKEEEGTPQAVAVGGKRDREDDLSNEAMRQQIQKVIDNGRLVGATIVRYEDAVGNGELSSKSRRVV